MVFLSLRYVVNQTVSFTIIMHISLIVCYTIAGVQFTFVSQKSIVIDESAKGMDIPAFLNLS